MRVWVIMVNDFPDSVALTDQSAKQRVLEMKVVYGEPISGSFKVRYIRAVPVPIHHAANSGTPEAS